MEMLYILCDGNSTTVHADALLRDVFVSSRSFISLFYFILCFILHAHTYRVGKLFANGFLARVINVLWSFRGLVSKTENYRR